MENVVVYNAEYGCPKCFASGKIHDGERGFGKKKKTFNIRIFPYEDFEERVQEECLKTVKDIEFKKKTSPYYGHYGRCPLTRLRFFKYGSSFLTDSLHTIYGGVFKKICLLLFDNKHKKDKCSQYKKVKDIDDLLHTVRIPSTTSRRYRTLAKIKKFKASGYRCLFHFGISTILQFIKDPMLKQLLLTLITAVNLASSDEITTEKIDTIELLWKYFVQQFQHIFGPRFMSSNVHSILHLHNTVKFIGVDRDLIAMVHGTTEYAKQIIKSLTLFRDAIITISEPRYPLRLRLGQLTVHQSAE
ncbi:unnamed protein product, partial [Didymodactylos carnosus]